VDAKLPALRERHAFLLVLKVELMQDAKSIGFVGFVLFLFLNLVWQSNSRCDFNAGGFAGVTTATEQQICNFVCIE
jgi:hypothetical protein